MDETHESRPQILGYSGSKKLQGNLNQISGITNSILRSTNKSGYCFKNTSQNEPMSISVSIVYLVQLIVLLCYIFHLYISSHLILSIHLKYLMS